jgi:hypothetical protein
VRHILMVSVSAIVTYSLTSCVRPVGDPPGAEDSITIAFDFRDGLLGWEAGFSDYAIGQEDDVAFVGRIDPLPDEVVVEGTGLLVSGDNPSADLFMFIKRRLGSEDGLTAGRPYRVDFTIRFASNAPRGCVGVGGPPGESVFLKAGASDVEPLTLVDADGDVRMNLDKGNQSGGGPAASVAGDIANSLPCEAIDDVTDAPFVTIERIHTHGSTVRSDERGNLWLLIGTDSGFESRTSIYYQFLEVTLTPMSGGL